MCLREVEILSHDAAEEVNVEAAEDHVKAVVSDHANIEVGPEDGSHEEVGDQDDRHGHEKEYN